MDSTSPLKLRPWTAPVGSRVVLRAKHQSLFEATVLEWAPDGKRVKLQNIKGEAYWRMDFEDWELMNMLLENSVAAPPQRPANCPHPDSAVKADILEGDAHVRVQWCECCGAFRFHWPYERMNGMGNPLPQYSEWRIPRPDWYGPREKEVDAGC